MAEKPNQPVDEGASLPTSVILAQLLDETPTGHFTLGWLMTRLELRSFGFILLLLAVIAVGPGTSTIAGLLMMIPAFQMVTNKPYPVFPRRIAERRLPTRPLVAVLRRSVPVLRYIEKIVHPRWPTPIVATKRLVGGVIIVVDLAVTFIPIPLSNVLPAMTIAALALALLEHDGVLLALALALAASLVVLVVVVALSWEIIAGAHWLGRL